LKLVHCHLHSLTLAQIDDVLSLHVDLSVHRIIRHFFSDPTGEVELLICLLQLNLCKHYAIQNALIDINVPHRASMRDDVSNFQASKNLRSISSGIELFRLSSDGEPGTRYSEVPAVGGFVTVTSAQVWSLFTEVLSSIVAGAAPPGGLSLGAVGKTGHPYLIGHTRDGSLRFGDESARNHFLRRLTPIPNGEFFAIEIENEQANGR
jgi:hypothetical protein